MQVWINSWDIILFFDLAKKNIYDMFFFSALDNLSGWVYITEHLKE